MIISKLIPGHFCPQTGFYRAYTSCGRATYTTKWLISGRKVPPTPIPGCYYMPELKPIDPKIIALDLLEYLLHQQIYYNKLSQTLTE